MGLDIKTLSAAKKYVQEALVGGGAIVGKNVIISDIIPIEGGNRVTFSYTLDNGKTETSSVDVLNGKDGINGKDGKQGEHGENGTNGVGITRIEKINTEGATDTYRIIFSNGEHFDYNVKNGEQGIQGIRGEKGEQGDRGIQGIQGIQGEKGDDGYPFLIYKEYETLSNFNVDDFSEIGLLFSITGEEGNLPVYRVTGESDNPYSFVTNLSASEGIKGEKGDKGDKGEQGIQGLPGVNGKDGTTYIPIIGKVTTISSNENANASVDIDNENFTARFNFSIPKGENGENGLQGTQGLHGQDGKTYTPQIGEITTVPPNKSASASVTIDEENLIAGFNFSIPKGEQGGHGNNGQDGKNAYQLALENGFTGTEDEWLESLKGEQGENGITPHIGENGNWWFGEKDSGTSTVEGLLEYANENEGVSDTPIGHIISVMSNSAPKHYLICDGKEYNITDYPYLAEHIRKEFGNYEYFGGDGETTFAVPDLRGEFLRGTGENSHTCNYNGTTWNEGSGSDVGVHQGATLQPILMNAKDKNVNYGWTGSFAGTVNTEYASGKDLNYDSSIGKSTGLYYGSDFVQNDQGNTLGTARPTNTSVLYCIKYEPTYFVNVDQSVELANNLTTTSEGFALDARQGKILSGEISSCLKNIPDSNYYNANNLPNNSIVFYNLDIGHSNFPTNATWGACLNIAAADQGFQIASDFSGSLHIRSKWSKNAWTSWKQIY